MEVKGDGFMMSEPEEEKEKEPVKVTIDDATVLYMGKVKATKCDCCGHHEIVLDTGEEEIPLKPGYRVIYVPKTRKESIRELLAYAKTLKW